MTKKEATMRHSASITGNKRPRGTYILYLGLENLLPAKYLAHSATNEVAAALCI